MVNYNKFLDLFTGLPNLVNDPHMFSKYDLNYKNFILYCDLSYFNKSCQEGMSPYIFINQ